MPQRFEVLAAEVDADRGQKEHAQWLVKMANYFRPRREREEEEEIEEVEETEEIEEEVEELTEVNRKLSRRIRELEKALADLRAAQKKARRDNE